MKSFCSHRGVEWHENWQNKYAGARPKKDGVILAQQLVTFFHPLYLTTTKNALAPSEINYGLELVIPTGSLPWVKNVCRSKELRSTCQKKYKLFILGPFPSLFKVRLKCLLLRFLVLLRFITTSPPRVINQISCKSNAANQASNVLWSLDLCILILVLIL